MCEQDISILKQSPGADPKTKRNSGLFSFLRWFKTNSRESVDNLSSTGSTDSLNSTGTAASFSFVAPTVYVRNKSDDNKCIVQGPETDTYKARLKQRDKIRERDKDITLRKKYNLFFQRDSLGKNKKEKEKEKEDNSRSLPLMTRKMEDGGHRRSNSESSKTKRAGAYLHVKGKRKAPQPPKNHQDNTLSLRRKKRLAPQPPIITDKAVNTLLEQNSALDQTSNAILDQTNNAILDHTSKTKVLERNGSIVQNGSVKLEVQTGKGEVICNDSLKLDHGILKQVKAAETSDNNQNMNASGKISAVEAPVSPRPWYKRNTPAKKENKYEPVELKLDKKEDKRKSGMMFLTNISELDREAAELMKKDQNILAEMPEFMRPKEDPETDTLTPKRRSAKDLIAKFNAITNVTKVTVNSAFFGYRENSIFQKNFQQKKDFLHQKRENQNPQKPEANFAPLMKSETSACIVKQKKTWTCKKCNVENDTWRLVCNSCKTTIKPYFDDSSLPKNTHPAEDGNPLERSKTQIGFSALANYNKDSAKREEREKLKKMLIEMKNSLPKRKSNVILNQQRKSTIDEDPELNAALRLNGEEGTSSKDQEWLDKANINFKRIDKSYFGINGADKPRIEANLDQSASKQNTNFKSEVIRSYNFNKGEATADPNKTSSSDPNLNKEDSKLKQFDENVTKKEEDIKLIKPSKVSSSAQTSAVVKKLPAGNKNFQLMRPKDFEDIYSEKSGKPNANHFYANLAQSENLFLNVPKRFSDIKNGMGANNTDTLEINRLLRRLENAIAKGDLSDAAIYARELAQLKVNCSVVRQKPPGVAGDDKNGFMVEMYVEDRLSHRGPFPIQVTEVQTVAELKIQVEKEFEIPRDVQRWILGKELASNDNTTLKDHNVCKEGCPIFLYLVAPSSNNGKEAIAQTKEDNKEINTPTPFKPLLNETKTKEESTKVINKTTEETNIAIKTTNESQANNKPITEATKENKPTTSNATKEPSPSKTPPKEISSAPRIVEEKFKPIERLTDTKSKQILKIQEGPTQLIKTKPAIEEIKSPVEEEANLAIMKELELKNPPMAMEEDFSEYDKTLKAPLKTWECQFCTLLNPLNTNVCLVCAAVRQKGATVKRLKKRAPVAPEAKTKHYQELMNLDNSDLVLSVESFECMVCFMEIEPGQGVTLRECLHQFCKDCLAHTVEFCEEAEVKCPYRDEQYSCDIALQDREVKALVTPVVYEQFLAKSVAQAENKIDKSFHCKTPDCKGWCIFEDNVNEFRCPVCRKNNCMTCQAIHIGLNCKQYQERMNDQSETDEDAKRTREMLEEMVNKGEALTCPACQVILMKKWGCDWVRCSMCKTEICWVTKGLRWGPAGKGDTSGGCKCGVNGVKCHPKCNYCH